MASHSPTRGQQYVLQLLCRVAYVLWATPSGSLSVTYTFTERDTERHIQTLTPTMVTSLVDAGWLEREPGYLRDAKTWTYRVTRAGVAAANLPRSG